MDSHGTLPFLQTYFIYLNIYFLVSSKYIFKDWTVTPLFSNSPLCIFAFIHVLKCTYSNHVSESFENKFVYRGANELKNLHYLPRSSEPREFLFEDRTRCHADHVDHGPDRMTTAAVGMLKAVHKKNGER